MAAASALSPPLQSPPHADTIAHRAYLSAVSAQRQGSLLVEQIPLTKVPGMLSLGGGMPNPTMFPFASVEVRYSSGRVVEYGYSFVACACGLGVPCLAAGMAGIASPGACFSVPLRFMPQCHPKV